MGIVPELEGSILERPRTAVAGVGWDDATPEAARLNDSIESLVDRLVAVERATASLAASYAQLERAAPGADLSDAELDREALKFWAQNEHMIPVGADYQRFIEFACAAVRYGYRLAQGEDGGAQ